MQISADCSQEHKKLEIWEGDWTCPSCKTLVQQGLTTIHLELFLLVYSNVAVVRSECRDPKTLVVLPVLFFKCRSVGL